MRVLHVIPSISDLRGGPTFVVRKMVSGLAEQGVSLTVVCTDDDGPGRKKPDIAWAKQQGIEVLVFERQSYFYSWSYPLGKWLASNIGKYDLVHIHSVFNFPVTVACLLARQKKIPYIVRPLGILSRWGFKTRHRFLKPLSFRLLEKPLLRNAYAIHVTSEMESHDVLSFLGPGQRQVLIPHFAPQIIVIPEPSEIKTADHPDNANSKQTKHILFLSRIDPKKGIELLLQAVSLVRRQIPDLQLLIAGSGDAAYVQKLKKQTKGLALDDITVWYDFVSGARKWQILRNANVMVLPSYAENFALAVLEALSVGTPVILSENVGLAAIIQKNNAGIVTTMDPANIAQALVSVLTNEVLSAKLAANGRELVKAEFSQESIIGRIQEMYQRAVSR